MRELVFTIEYEPGRNAVADTLATHSEARIRSLSLHATDESLWRVDHASGSADALEAIKETFQTADYYADCLATEDCGATQTTQVLEHTDETLVLYSYWRRTEVCASVPHFALDHLGDGLLFETRHTERTYQWRVIYPSGDVRSFLDEVESAVSDGGKLTVERLTEATQSGEDNTGMSAEQEAALRAAVEHGYYETPREIDVGELAEQLDIPRSTLTYRLRRAEATLARGHIDDREIPAHH